MKRTKYQDEQWNKCHRINEDSIIERKCTTCNTWYPETIEHYYMMNKSKPQKGYMAQCKNCIKVSNNNTHEINRERTRGNNRKYFYNNKDKRLSEMKVRYIDKNDDWKEYFRKYQQSEAGKASAKRGNQKHKEKEHIINDIEWHNCKMYFNMRCAYCGLPIEEHWVIYRRKNILGDFHKEHVIHIGKNDLSNCVPSCESCNSSKHEKTLNQWYNENNPNYTYERYLKIYIWYRYDYKKYIMPKRKFKGQLLKARLKEIEINKNRIKLNMAN